MWSDNDICCPAGWICSDPEYWRGPLGDGLNNWNLSPIGVCLRQPLLFRWNPLRSPDCQPNPHREARDLPWIYGCASSSWYIRLWPFCSSICYCACLGKTTRRLPFRPKQDEKTSLAVLWGKEDGNVSIHSSEEIKEDNGQINSESPSLLHM